MIRMSKRNSNGGTASAVHKGSFDENYWRNKRYAAAMLRSEGRSMRMIADVLNVSIGFVCKWCHRLSKYIDMMKEKLLLKGIRTAINSESRKPRTVHNKNSNIQDVLDIKKKYSWMGSQKLAVMLRSDGIDVSHQYVYETCVRHELMTPGLKKQRKFVRFERSHSNSLWQFDISEFDGSRIHMLTFIDDHSRFVLGTMVLDRPFKTEDVLELFEKVILMFGKPEAVLSDNGMQWTAMRGGECRFDILCNELGIKHIRGRPYKPTTQGKIERYHRSIKTEAYLPEPGSNLKAYKKAILDYIEFYNSERPHFSLNMKIPCDIYLADFKSSETIL